MPRGCRRTCGRGWRGRCTDLGVGRMLVDDFVTPRGMTGPMRASSDEETQSNEEGGGAMTSPSSTRDSPPGTELCWHSPCNLDRIKGNGAE